MAEREELNPGVLVEFKVITDTRRGIKSFWARGVVRSTPYASAGPFWGGYVVSIDMSNDKKYCETFPKRLATTKRIEKLVILEEK